MPQDCTHATPNNESFAVSGFATRFALTGVSGMVAESCTFPIDMVKTRMQLQGELQHGVVERRGAIGLLTHALRTEGVRGVYSGLAPAVARHIPYTGCRIFIYEKLRQSLSTQGEAPALGVKMFMGATSGALGQLVAVPADVIKVRMQADGRLVASGKLTQPRYTGLAQAFGCILREEGLRGLYKGATPAVQRAAMVNLGELATYDQSKEMVLASGVAKEGIITHTIAAMASGLVATIFSTPADVVKTRMMNQRSDAAKYRSTIDCAIQTIRIEGLVGMYKGFFPTWARLGPWQLAFWLSYEQLRSLSGLGGF